MKKKFKREFNVRYFKLNDEYTFTVDKRFLRNEIAVIIFNVEREVYEDTLANIYNGTKLISHIGIRYTFKTKKDAKGAVEWLRTLLVAKQMCK